MYKSKYFKIHELVDPDTYNNTKEWKLWLAFDERLLKILDILREDPVIGVPITINNWKWGKDRKWSGLRNSSSLWYTPWSQHTYGRAVDMLFKDMNSGKVRERIKEMVEAGEFKDIVNSVTCEATLNGKQISWVHLDIRNNKPGYNELNI